MARDTRKDNRNQVMYSIFVRNHSREGSFQAVIPDLPRIKELGVDIIWLMPIHPIGKEKRKGTLGSPYAIQDYRKINPELGLEDDFKELVDEIHKLGMKCIIDVVYNHTSPDSWLVKHHREYFKKAADGSLTRGEEEWQDIVDLDYANKSLWKFQIDTLKMWAELVDGFRCDVAPLIPLEFWQQARDEVKKVNPECFWLSETVEPEYILHNRNEGRICLSDAEIYQAFDAAYDYDAYGYFVGYLRGENQLQQYIDIINMQEYIYPDNYIKLRFYENHDRERIKELISDENRRRHWTAFLYFQKGMTLLYAGQETENAKRPDLFDKDTINWSTGKDISDFLRRLYQIKQNPIMANGQYNVKLLQSKVIHAVYKLSDTRVDGYFNTDGNAEIVIETDLPDGDYTNLIGATPVLVRNGTLKISIDPIIIE